METREALRQCIRRAQLVGARLRAATMRLTDADQERSWAIVAADETVVSIRTQLRLCQGSPTAWPTGTDTEPCGGGGRGAALVARLAGPTSEWRTGDRAPAPRTEDATAYVLCDHARGRRVLARRVADLDTWTRQAPEAEPASPEEMTASHTWPRDRLAEPEEAPPSGRLAKELRAA
jgi:hypothetical protein